MQYGIIFSGLLLAAIILPWWVAYNSDEAVSYRYGLVNGHELGCVAIDGTHFDRYFCLVFDSSSGARVNCAHGHILLDGRPLQFPSGQNIGFLRPDGRIDFSTVTARDIAPNSSGRSEIHYIFGTVRKQKHFAFGVPRAEFIEQRFQRLK